MLSEVLGGEYSVSYCNFMRNYWNDGDTYSCLGQPKEQNLFLYLDGCSVEYKLKDGRAIRGGSGDFLYIPSGSEYKVRFCCDGASRISTLGVNFLLYSKGVEISDPDGICVFDGEALRFQMVELERLSYTLCNLPMKYNLILYGMFDKLTDRIGRKKGAEGFEVIRIGVEYLHKHYDENMGVDQLSSMCNVSSVYFRRLFKLQTGMSPTEYRTHLRLLRAAELLRFGELPISEISERLGFVDSSYFVKRFKEKYDETPLSYRKKLL